MKLSTVLLCLAVLFALTTSDCEALKWRSGWSLWGNKKPARIIVIAKRPRTSVAPSPSPSIRVSTALREGPTSTDTPEAPLPPVQSPPAPKITAPEISTPEETDTDQQPFSAIDTTTEADTPIDAETDDECRSVEQTAVTVDDLRTLVTAVAAADIVDMFGPDFVGTAFAPTNDAFVELLTTLDLTLQDVLSNTELLTTVLLLHVVPDVAIFAEDLFDGQELTTVGGGNLTVSVTDDGVTLTSPGGQVATVVTPNIEACDAVIHVIDQVLTPAP
eukprot:g2305.t1